jgi:hypothetical protein
VPQLETATFLIVVGTMVAYATIANIFFTTQVAEKTTSAVEKVLVSITAFFK